MDNRKLHILFLSVLSSMKEDETNCQIATYILEHLDEVRDMSIVELAKCCFVSNSSISRFCKEMGLHDFSELKELLQNSEREYKIIGTSPNRIDNLKTYIHQVQDDLSVLENSLDYEALDRIANDLMKYDKVAAFGLLNAEAVAMAMQSDMMHLGKMISTKISYQQQRYYLKNTTHEDLILIFSGQGLFLNSEFHQRVLNKKDKPRIILITGNQEIKADNSIDEILYIPIQSSASLRTQLMMVECMIVQNYAMKQKEQDF